MEPEAVNLMFNRFIFSVVVTIVVIVAARVVIPRNYWPVSLGISAIAVWFGVFAPIINMLNTTRFAIFGY